MKKIAITGGKGGTGKSTFAVLLAKKYLDQGKKVILVDCDIECPNDYLLVGKKLGKHQEKVYASFPELDKSKCQKCGQCVKVCKNNAIFQAPSQFPNFILDVCSGCGACQIVCPYGAIYSRHDEIGKIFVNKIKENFYLATGLSKPALEETAVIVHQLKKYVNGLIEKIKPDFVIFDTAAGTHCPVVAALLDSDLVYVVTEPTPLGNHDLNIILDLLAKMKLPVEVILNQYDLGDENKVKNILKKFKIKQIKKKIPYSAELVRSYANGNFLNLDLQKTKVNLDDL